MKKFLLSLFALLCLTGGVGFARNEVTKVVKPQEVVQEATTTNRVPKELEGLQWNRWTSKNFTVCALDNVQAQYLHRHLELVKIWAFERWGLADVDFSAECKIIAVDSAELFKKLFNLDRTRVEIRRDPSGKIKESVIFLLCNSSPSEVIPSSLTEVCLAELAQRQGVKLPYWSVRGMSILNGTITSIRERIAEIRQVINRNDPLFFSKGLMEVDADGYHKLDAAKQRLFDNCAMMFCLLVRKEFGQASYLRVLKVSSESGAMQSLQSVLHFDGFDHFDKSFKRFLDDLSREVTAGKTPDHYLQVNGVRSNR